MRGILLCLLFTAFFLSTSATASIIYVGESGYSNLQEAVNASLPGDTIIIQEGIYNGTEIDKPLIMKGEGGVIEGDVVIKANNVTIDSLIIKDAYHALEMKGDYCIIRNCTIAGNSYGIKIEGNNNSIMSNKIFKNRFYGIYLDYAHSNRMEGNVIYGNGWGIYLEHSTSNLIEGNDIKNNSEGIKIQASNGNVVKRNNISGNEEMGMHLCCKSGGNFIFMNNFMKNRRNALAYADENHWDFNSKGNYWDDYNGSGEYVIYTENVDHNPSLHPYIIDVASKKEIIFFSPEEGMEVKGSIKVEGLNEVGGYVEWRVDNESWRRANGTFFWSFFIDTKKIGNGYHSIQVRCGDLVAERHIYVVNKRNSPSFATTFSVFAISLIFAWKYMRRKGR